MCAFLKCNNSVIKPIHCWRDVGSNSTVRQLWLEMTNRRTTHFTPFTQTNELKLNRSEIHSTYCLSFHCLQALNDFCWFVSLSHSSPFSGFLQSSPKPAIGCRSLEQDVKSYNNPAHQSHLKCCSRTNKRVTCLLLFPAAWHFSGMSF